MTYRFTTEAKIACEECGLVMSVPVLDEGEKATCPRCHHGVAKQINQPFQRPMAFGIATLVMLALSVSFPFMSFSVQGLNQNITLLHAAFVLQHFENSLLALLLLLTVVILPGCYIVMVMYLYRQSAHIQKGTFYHANKNTVKRVARLLFHIEPWLMVDVFLIGVLVSLIKIASLADVGLGMSFWAFCIYTGLVVKFVSMVDRTWLWHQIEPLQPLAGVNEGDSHISGNHESCHLCAQLNPPVNNAPPQDSNQHKPPKCHRCGSRLHPYDPTRTLQRSWALLLTSMVFYIPANLYPMMYTVSLGQTEGSTIMGGVVLLWKLGSYPIAFVIFFASVIIPLAKMMALIWLFIHAQRGNESSAQQAIQSLKIYRMTEFIGRWSMIDIFVVAILVALVQLHNLMAIFPGPAALSFAAVVVFTMLSAMSFDPRVFWTQSSKSKMPQASSTSDIPSNGNNDVLLPFNENKHYE
ncbi:paraquat-inducible protein A [Photobacterium sanguinicancri]|uniref:paraquat-inducible protein A n=1 Tax=Photobacterium sanguinicancri TaxID=875932 RepID=UPI000789A159|nr:paraquat-inducible protein A [Photobacterium sanguinicancri]KXI21240.1 paraquat-inducible protein A [Photobacterium sanguinicancri]